MGRAGACGKGLVLVTNSDGELSTLHLRHHCPKLFVFFHQNPRMVAVLG